MEAKQNMSINKKQIQILTDYMNGHQDLAKGILKSAQGRKSSRVLWEKLTDSLNTEGPPQKGFKDWKKTWSNPKYKVKNKLRKNKVHLKGTGGGPYMQKPMEELEEKIIECAGLEAAVEGIPTAKTFGVGPGQIADRNNNEETKNLDREGVEYNIFEENVECEGNSTHIKNARSATEKIIDELDAIHKMLCSSHNLQKRRLDIEEKQYKLKKRS